MKRAIVLLALALLSFSTLHAQEVANWTILHYTAVDNNLEGAAFNDYYEMQLVGSGDGIEIVTEFDRAEGYESRFGNWTDTRRFHIEQRPPLPELDMAGKRQAVADYYVAAGAGDAAVVSAGLSNYSDATIQAIYENNNVGVSFDQETVQDLGEVDMGDPQSLVDFLTWGVQNYPANHYMVVIGSHGGGWKGIGPDEGQGESQLELPEIDAALGAVRANLGIEKFDIVGFDACLMGVSDVAVMLEKHAQYVLFSQEVIPSNGWEYANSLQAVKDNLDWDAFQVGSAFIDNYMAYYAGVGNRQKVGLSLVETAGLPTLLASLQNFAAVVGADEVNLLSALGTARKNSQVFAASLGTSRADEYSYVDLRDFMTWFSLQTTITEDAYNAAQAVIAAYDGAVVYALADSKLPRANGMGVYLPSAQYIYDIFSADYVSRAPADFAFWQNYLAGFYSTIASALDGSSLQLEIKQVLTLSGTGSSIDTPIVFFNAGGKGVIDLKSRIGMLNADGSQTLVDYTPISYNTVLPTGETVIEYPNELTPSTFNWSVEMPLVSDGSGQALGLLQISADGSQAVVTGTLVNAAGQQSANLIFDVATRQLIGVISLAGDAPAEVYPLPGDQFLVDMYSLSAENSVVIEPQANRPLTFGLQPFTYSYVPAPSGTYRLSLIMSDLANNTVVSEADLTVNNDAVDGTLRGYTDTNTGVHFVYPYAWGESAQVENDDGSISNAVTSDDGTTAIFVDSYDGVDALTTLQNLISTLQGDFSEISETTLGGLTAYVAQFSVQGEDGAVTTGYMVSSLNEKSNAAVVFTVQSGVGDLDAVQMAINLVDSSVFYFAPVLEVP